MSTYEAAYKSLLQGVSQQLPQERLPGQLSAQVNMLSDPVTNLRRRHGAVMRASWSWEDADHLHLLTWFVDVAGSRIHVYLNTVSGQIKILDETYAIVATLEGGAYLTTANARSIRASSVGNEFFLCNVEKKPVLEYNTTGMDPAKAGFFYVTSGAFGRGYNVTLTWPGGGTATATYTTPGGTGGGDAALSTPEYIATQLANSLTASAAGNYTVYRTGPYVFVQTSVHASLAVNTTVGTQYLIGSKSGFVNTAGDLPARLPVEADGFICRVGTGDNPQYFRYEADTTEWVESASWDSPTGITNMPIAIYWTGSAWALNTSGFEGSTAGDSTSNPPHEFMTFGITGMSTYQGRLVLMSGPLVSLSGSNKPRRFFRSTVTSVLSSDPVEIGSGMTSAAAYEWAVPFQKDLLLFSRAYQAVIPSANTAITPSNATVVPTSSHETDVTCSPISVGRTLMYCNPRSEDFFGVLEMIPSSYTDSQYVSQDSTPHLPKYMPGRCRFAVSSGVASMALFSPTNDDQSLIVHEYHWDGDTKVQQAWHQWLYEYPVASAYFAADVIVIVFVQNEQVVLGTVDPRAGAVAQNGQRRPYLDLNVSATITDHSIPIPAWMLAFDPTIASKLVAVVAAGPSAGEWVGTSVSGDGLSLTTVRSYPSGNVKLGIPYYSGAVPSQPIITDYNQEVIHTGKATLLRYTIGTANSSEFDVRVDDAYSRGDPNIVPTLSWSSPELQLGQALFSAHATSIVPCRTDLRTTQMEIWTEGTGELNITSLEYVAKFNAKIKRR